MPSFDWEVHIWLGPHSFTRPEEFVVQVQAPNVGDALVLAFARYRESHKNLEDVLGFYITVKNLTIEQITRSER